MEGRAAMAPPLDVDLILLLRIVAVGSSVVEAWNMTNLSAILPRPFGTCSSPGGVFVKRAS